MKNRSMNESLDLLGIRGKVGNLIFKKYRNGTVITKCPDMSHVGCSARQRLQRNRFQQAITRAKAILSCPEQKQYYEQLPGKGSAWNKALATFMMEHKT